MDNFGYQQSNPNNEIETKIIDTISNKLNRNKSNDSNGLSWFQANDDDDDDHNERSGRKRKICMKWLSTLRLEEKLYFLLLSLLRIILLIALLYMFLLSLNFMTIGFTMVSGYAIKAGNVIRFILSNPFAALAIGIIVTAIMQNATATTSIAVSMVGAGIIPNVQSAIPIIMGANIGTCVTNSLIALTLSGDPNEFKRAFSAATLNDMFNLLTISILLPIELLTGFLNSISLKIVDLLRFNDNAELIQRYNFVLKVLKPVQELFIVLDPVAVDAISSNAALVAGSFQMREIALRCCNSSMVEFQISQQETDGNSSVSFYTNQTICLQECSYWCMPMLRAFGDGGTGLFWIVLSILVLISCLFGIVKVLSLLIVGPIAKGVNIAINASFPGYMKWFTQVVLFVIALLLTIIVQSSNIITATLVPLCGIGIVTLQRVFVMTLGSNIGTTVTGILTAFIGPPASLRKSMQLAFVYTLFNSMGVLMWLPIPYLRFPKILARGLGNIVFRYRWFLFVYVLSVYFIMPLIVFGIALVPYWIGLAVLGLAILFLLISYSINKNVWLPMSLKSLKYWDDLFKRLRLVDKVDHQAASHRRHSSSCWFSHLVRRLNTIDSILIEGANLSLATAKRRLTLPLDFSSGDEEIVYSEKHKHSLQVSPIKNDSQQSINKSARSTPTHRQMEMTNEDEDVVWSHSSHRKIFT